MISNYVAIATIITIVLIFFKVPVFSSVFLGSVIYFILNPNVDIVIAAQRITSGMESVSILACPFFIFAGVLFNYCGVTERLVEFCSLVTGRIYGGLAQTNILLSTVMGGMSGSSVAGAVMEGKKGFFCEGRECGFALWKENRFFTAKKKKLTKAVASALLKEGRVPMSGLYSEKTGRTYDAVVMLDDTGGKYVNFRLEFPAGKGRKK